MNASLTIQPARRISTRQALRAAPPRPVYQAPDRARRQRAARRRHRVAAAALLAEYGHPPRDEDREIAPFLAKNLTKTQIMRTIELLQKYHGECVYNVGPSHVLGALAVELEGIL